MKIEVVKIKENKDDSFTCTVEMDEDSITHLIRYGLVKSIEEAIQLAEKEYAPRKKNE